MPGHKCHPRTEVKKENLNLGVVFFGVTLTCLIAENLTDRKDSGGEVDFGSVLLSREVKYDFKDINMKALV